MALSNAEKVRRYRERQKAARDAAPDLVMGFIKKPLSDTRPSDGDDPYEFVENLIPVGLQFPAGFFDERYTYNVDMLIGRKNSMSGKPLLERMEALASTFLDAAAELHQTINAFKLAEIDARIAEIEQADLSDPETKTQALRDIVALQTIRAQLDGKTFRRAFSEISVKGSPSNE